MSPLRKGLQSQFREYCGKKQWYCQSVIKGEADIYFKKILVLNSRTPKKKG